MRIISISTLKELWENNPAFIDEKETALAWYRHVLKADWGSPNMVKRDFGQASVLQDGRVVFNIAGNKYRLIAAVKYQSQIVYIRHILTHIDYGKGKWKQ